MRIVNIIAYILILIGAINLGLVGIFNFDALWAITGHSMGAIRIIYGLVGIAGLWSIVFMSKHICRKTW